MNNTFIINHTDPINRLLTELWNDNGREIPWDDFLISLDNNIEMVQYDSGNWRTFIWFHTEEGKIMFLLKWL